MSMGRKIPQYDDNEIIVLENVSKAYTTGAPALDNVSIKIGRGEFVFIVGDSGSGKSTLIKLILLEEKPTAGRIFVNSHNVSKIRNSNIQKYRRSIN